MHALPVCLSQWTRHGERGKGEGERAILCNCFFRYMWLVHSSAVTCKGGVEKDKQSNAVSKQTVKQEAATKAASQARRDAGVAVVANEAVACEARSIGGKACWLGTERHSTVRHCFP